MPPSRKSKLKIESTRIRFGSRVGLNLAVQLSVDATRVGLGTIRNASISGALIETALDLPLHTNLLVTLAIPGEEMPAPRLLAACVVRIDPAGVGIEWRDMAGADVIDLLVRASHHEAVD
jgi:hypothetical protein